MALETWLTRVRKTISNTLDTAKSSRHKSNVGVLSFEIAGLMSKLLHLWNSLSDDTVIRLRNESISLEGIGMIVSDDESFLLDLQKLIDLQQKLLWQKQEVKCLKENSLWSKSFDMVVSMLVRSVFTILQRVKLVFGLGHGYYPSSLPRSPSASATVYPTVNPNTYNFVSGPLKGGRKINFFESNSKLLKPPSSTLGASALSLHYANLIIVLEKMMNTPQLVGIEARDDLYSMLPSSIRSSLRARLKGVGFTASDPVLAGEWRVALGRILSWLSPLAHNMIKLQNERSLEHQNSLPRTNVLLLHTLFFANIDKTEAAITELLVGLNYIWRFEREMTAKVLFECS
ncbi:protein PSK SIMULATOR 1-like [Hibiscus syriacus]|uniref:protein PSK SIMULATOR 1-like n=1 Tax=Hibiscus syriacus TaxID=106335 RepID=UPI0019247A49|nr:protein PSK SIMULATOR 1-like [Hibiscus syriacus]